MTALPLPGVDATMTRTAVISPCGTYRYRLSRMWDPVQSTMCFVMLNPSTADAQVDDPTIRRCISFAKREGFGSIDVVNLYAWRATDPADLIAARQAGCDVEGPHNRDHVYKAMYDAGMTVAAWGAWPETHGGVPDSFPTFDTIWCLGRTKGGSPRHPLYMPARQPLIEWWSL